MFSVFAVQVVQTSEPVVTEPSNAQVIGSYLGVVFFFLIFGGIAIGIIVWVIVTIQRKIAEYNQRKRDFIYYDFENNLHQCHINRDQRLKYKNWKTFNIMWKRTNVYVKTKTGLEFIGQYQGECKKKENFYMIALYNKLGWFKYVESIVFIPILLKDDLVIKMEQGKNVNLIIYCEGIDNIANMDYYFIPLISDPESPKEFLDFADMIHTEYLEKIIYRDVIKENLQQYREGIIKSVETNPNVQFSRRTEKN